MKFYITSIFGPYLALYLIAWALSIPLSFLFYAFQFLHLAFALYIAKKLWGFFKNAPLGDKVFWSLLALFFLLPGAYLEFPSDPWEHFRRIFRWQHLGYISDYPVNCKAKFAYFWAYSLLGFAPIGWRIKLCGLYSAFWEILLCLSLYRLLKLCKVPKRWAYIHIVAFIATFGTNLFGIRYYALASTPLAYCAYLELLSALVAGVFKDNPKTLVWGVALCTIIAFNHIQELIFVALMSSALAAYSKLSVEIKKLNLQLVCAAFLIFTTSILYFGMFLIHNYPNIYSNMIPGQLNRFGMFKIWDSSYGFYMETITVAGWVSLVCSTIFFEKSPLLFYMTLVPSLSLLFPITAAIYAYFIPTGYLTYRILYAFPLSVGLVEGIRAVLTITRKAYIPHYLKAIIPSLAFIAAVLIVTPYSYPFRGKIFMQIYLPPKSKTLTFLNETAEWLKDTLGIKKLKNCWILTDTATKTVISAHLGIDEYHYGGEATRRARTNYLRAISSIKDINSYVKTHTPFCGLLVANTKALPESPSSLIGRSSGHWKDEWANIKWLTGKNVERVATKLLKHGWKALKVPPFYTLYMPQSR